MKQFIVAIHYKDNRNTFVVPNDYITVNAKTNKWSVYLSSSDCQYVFKLFGYYGNDNEILTNSATCTVFEKGTDKEIALGAYEFSINSFNGAETNEFSLLDEINDKLISKIITNLVRLDYAEKDEIQIHYENDFLIFRMNTSHNQEDCLYIFIEIFVNKVWKNIKNDDKFETFKRLLMISDKLENLKLAKKVNKSYNL